MYVQSKVILLYYTIRYITYDISQIVTSEFYMTTLQEYGLNIKSEHFVISQGNIECIVTKTPNELNKIFEQISGSYMYKSEYKRYTYYFFTRFHRFYKFINENLLCVYDMIG